MTSKLVERLKVRISVEFELDGEKVFDWSLFRLLKAIDERGSILAASRAVGISYAKAWEMIDRAERRLDIRLVERSRAGRTRGAKLTEEAKTLLRRYMAVLQKYGVRVEYESSKGLAPDLTIAGSHDLLLEHIVRETRRLGFDVETSWIGSMAGLASLMIGDSEIVPVHLYDARSGEYNIPFLKRLWLSEEVVVVRGYMRQIGLAYHPSLEVKRFDDVIEGRLRFINRVKGSGTRVHLEHLIEEYAKRHNMKPEDVRRSIIGYDREVRTHRDVAMAIVRGEADVGLAIKPIAELYGLCFKPLKWEWFDFVVSRRSLSKRCVRKFIEILRSDLIREIANKISGYRVTNEVGSIIYEGRSQS
ncbi:MAG: hypothetical protein DRM97_03990 [Thermoprotei archaeon]|nr:MAG: hypothetical protein DRM97_03990 [Thermoprotei archaeon]